MRKSEMQWRGGSCSWVRRERQQVVQPDGVGEVKAQHLTHAMTTIGKKPCD